MRPLEALKPQQQAPVEDLEEINRKLEGMSAEQRVEWALHYLPGNHIMTSSFGIQGALMLHLVSRILPDIPVVLVDT
ncbi:MAG: phosphoadenosine phosphosulfate reductase, partial [Candidatus Thiodiazotropha sp.]